MDITTYIKKSTRRIKNKPVALLYILLILLILIAAASLPNFLTLLNLSNIILRSVTLLAVSIGQTMVLLVAGIDLSVSGVVALTTVLASYTMNINIALGIAGALLAGGAVGFFNGLGVTKLKVNPFIMTLASLSIVQGIALYLRPYPGGHIPLVYIQGILKDIGGFPIVPFFLSVFLAVTSWFFLKKTRFGRHIFAVGGNPEASLLAGINVDFVKIGAFIASGLLAALGGLYLTARIGCGDPTVGGSYQLDSIAAAVLGGTPLTGGRGSVGGTVFGVLILAFMGNIFNLMNLNIYWQQVLRGIILFVVVASSQMSQKRVYL